MCTRVGVMKDEEIRESWAQNLHLSCANLGLPFGQPPWLNVLLQ